MKFRYFFLKMGLLDLTIKRMRDLTEESNYDMIQWAFDNGKYDVRLMAVEYFVRSKGRASVSFLTKAMNDATEVVSQAAMSGLDAFPHTQEVQDMVAEKRQFWLNEQQYREGRRNRSHIKTSVLTESKERGSKKTLDNVRNMLKKPINGGKWF